MKRFLKILLLNRKLITVVIIYYSISITAFTVNNPLIFNTERLKQVFALLPEKYRNEIRDKYNSSPGSYFLNADVNGRGSKIVVRINEYKEIDHLGLYLINDSLNVTSVRELFDYLEREFLVSALSGEKYPLAREADNKRLEIRFNGRTLINRRNLPAIPKLLITKDTPFSLRYDSNSFLVEWTIDLLNKLEIKIPNDYSLITEKSKEEMEQALLRKLECPQKGTIFTERPARNRLKLYEANIYLCEGDIYSTVPDLSSNKYFAFNDSIYPVFNSWYYRESICNLFQNIISTHLNIDITQRLYGGKEKEFKINVNSFFKNFSKDYKIYFGWQNIDKDNLKASIFISNTVYNFNHLLEITTNSTAVFRKNGEVKALFYAYIPKEYINKSYK